MFPTPAQMLGIPKFNQWYPGQEDIFRQLVDWMDSDSRFACAPIPTGFGKSLLAMLTHNWNKVRTAYVTSTKGLQDQLMQDFQGIHLQEIKGRNSYPCHLYPALTTDIAPCTYGFQCPEKADCNYFSALGKARRGNLVSTNYAYWLSQHGYSDGISAQVEGGSFGLLVLDEGHMAARAIESYMRVELDVKELERFPGEFPRGDYRDGWHAWQERAEDLSFDLRMEFQELEDQIQDNHEDIPQSLINEHRFVRNLLSKVSRLASATEEWVPEEHDGEMVFTPIEPKAYNASLFLDVPKILILSAVMTERAALELGIEDPTWITAGSPFPAENAPFTHIKTIRVDYRWTEQMQRQWVGQIDAIIRTRLDRKGIIHTGSYDRMDIIRAYSKYREHMYVHGRRNTIDIVNQFKHSNPESGGILVSPSVTTGWDFPGKECEYIIWGKVPYPFSHTPLAKARNKADSTNSDWEAMKSLVQGAGRGNRREEDRCETFIIDDHWGHFWKYNKQMAPDWFHERVRKSTGLIPEPLEVE